MELHRTWSLLERNAGKVAKKDMGVQGGKVSCCQAAKQIGGRLGLVRGNRKKKTIERASKIGIWEKKRAKKKKKGGGGREKRSNRIRIHRSSPNKRGKKGGVAATKGRDFTKNSKERSRAEMP